jgi:chromosome segregation protein
MISRLVEAKPEELRAFLEEAAGISKYKERRRETERRIRHTRENLDRLRDLREEVDKQLGHLQRQARAASRYKKLMAEQRQIGAELLGLRLLGLKAEVRDEESKRNEKQTILDAAIAEQRSTETKIEKLRVEHSVQSDDLNSVQGKYYKVGAEIARLEQSIQHRKELSQRQKEDLRVTDDQLGEIKAHIESDQVEIEEIERLLRELSPGLEEAHLSHQSSLDALRQVEEASEEWRGSWEEATDALAETERLEEVEEARLGHLGSQIQRLELERKKLDIERTELRTADFDQRLDALVENEERLSSECQEVNRVLDTTWQQIQSLQEHERKTLESLEQVRGELHTARGQLTSLEALQDVALGHGSKQTNDWLESQALVSKPRLVQSLVVEPGWERAVETVLGDYLQAVCVDNIEALAKSLSSLSEGGLILLDQSGNKQFVDNGQDQKLSRYAQGHSVGRLLADVFAAESLAGAMEIRKRLKAHESVVTREGVWIGQSWLRINRSDDPQAGVLARGDEMLQLQDEVDVRIHRAEGFEKELTGTRRKLEDLEESRAKTQAKATERQQFYSETKSNLETTRVTLEQASAHAATLDHKITDIDGEIRSLSDILVESEEALRVVREHRDELESSREELGRMRAHHQEHLSDARVQVEKDRELTQEIALKVESRRSSKESAAAALDRVRTQQEHLTRRKSELQSQLESAADPIGDEARVLEEQLGERLNVENKLSSARRATEEADARLRDASQQRTDQEQLVNVAREVLDGTRLVVREIQVRAETVTDQLKQSGFGDVDSLVDELDEEATIEVWEETAEKLERRILRLGAINLAAIDEFEQQSERKEYLDSQFADLTEALETLENAIRKIDRETRTRFKETFDAANVGLGRLFPRLYGGGHAYLELEGDDLLNSGVTVMARPPGKRISTIHLLSGGEKALTAVALVFSIFELNPAPFCLLDEVDAPLDDANVGRFSEIVNEMSQQVQFVIITHNKTTMETMHQLTGVTMNEPGVSRLVAVDIDEAVKLAAI